MDRQDKTVLRDLNKIKLLVYALCGGLIAAIISTAIKASFSITPDSSLGITISVGSIFVGMHLVKYGFHKIFGPRWFFKNRR